MTAASIRFELINFDFLNFMRIHLDTFVLQQRTPGGSGICCFLKDNLFLQNFFGLEPRTVVLLRF